MSNIYLLTKTIKLSLSKKSIRHKLDYLNNINNAILIYLYLFPSFKFIDLRFYQVYIPIL